jgi:hypothetical protein
MLNDGETPIKRVLSKLKGVKRSGAGWVAKCPGHSDNENSLGVDVIDGKVMLKCFAGCDTEHVVSSMGLGLADLFSDDPVAPEEKPQKQEQKSCTLDALCAHKKLSREFVCGLGWRESITRGLSRVEIPYPTREGKVHRVRHRFALNAKDGSSWSPGASLIPYEPDKGALAAEEGYVLVVEGETDTVTLLHAGIPALGLPGASQAKLLEAHHVAGLKCVFVCQETDAAGESFVDTVKARLEELGFDGAVHVFRTPGAAKDPNTLHQRDPEHFPQLMHAALIEAAKPPPEPLDHVWKTLGEWGSLASEPPPRRWLLDRPDDECNGARQIGVFPMGKVGMLVAAGGVGKTMALIELALAVATGRKWFDFFGVANEGPVLLALGEEDEEEIWRRVYQAARAMRLTDAQVEKAARNIVALPLAGTVVNLIKSADGETVETAMMTALRKRLDQAQGVGWRLIILDPLSRFAGFDSEKDNAAATAFISVVESLLRVPGRPAILIAHHTNKASRQEGAQTGNAANSRGASALTDGVRWVANLDPLADGTVSFKVTKTNYSMGFDPIILTRDADYGGFLRVQTQAEATAVVGKRAERKAKAMQTMRDLVIKTISERPGLRSGNDLYEIIQGNRPALLQALRELKLEGFVTSTADGLKLTERSGLND